MATPKKYFHDHFVLLLLTINAFLTILVIILVLSRLSSQHTSAHFVQYRSNLGSNGYKTGPISDTISFIIFAIVILISQIFLSLRVYRIHRQLAISVLGLGVLLQVLAIIISNALLVL